MGVSAERRVLLEAMREGGIGALRDEGVLCCLRDLGGDEFRRLRRQVGADVWWYLLEMRLEMGKGEEGCRI